MCDGRMLVDPSPWHGLALCHKPKRVWLSLSLLFIGCQVLHGLHKRDRAAHTPPSNGTHLASPRPPDWWPCPSPMCPVMGICRLQQDADENASIPRWHEKWEHSAASQTARGKGCINYLLHYCEDAILRSTTPGKGVCDAKIPHALGRTETSVTGKRILLLLAIFCN